MSKVIELTSEGFSAAIASGKVMVDFWAPWCGPCKMMLPILDQIADEMGEEIDICKFNIDDDNELAVEYGVSTVPCFILFENGEVVKTLTGPQSKQKLINALT